MSTGAHESSPEARAQAARELLARTRGVPSLPQAAARVGQLASDPDADIDDLVKALTGDPALCVQLLKVANSAYYGARAEVATIKHATMMLGQKTIRSIAMAASIRSVLPKQFVDARFQPHSLWIHAIRTAGGSARLAKLTGVASPEDAFVAGLLHDLGLLVELQHDTLFAQVIDETFEATGEVAPAGLEDSEVKRFGADHQDLGAALLESWGIPRHLALAAGHHHEPLRAEGEERMLALVVHAIESIGIDGEHGLVRSSQGCAIAPEVLELLGLDAEGFEALVPELLDAGVEADMAYGLPGSAAA